MKKIITLLKKIVDMFLPKDPTDEQVEVLRKDMGDFLGLI